MAKLIPLYSNSSRAEIDLRAQKLFDKMQPKSGGYPKCWEQAEANYLEHLRVTPLPGSVQLASIGTLFI